MKVKSYKPFGKEKPNLKPFGKEEPIIKPFGNSHPEKSSSPMASLLIEGSFKVKAQKMKGGSN